MENRFWNFGWLGVTVGLGLLLAGCASDGYIGELDPEAGQAGLISFRAGTQALTRSSLSGAQAAAKLGNSFVVYATKHSQAEIGPAKYDELVFGNYHVTWADGTAGSTLSNTSGWEYNGNTSYSASTTDQTVKYWDYDAAAGYTFSAFSSRDLSYPARSSDPIIVTKLTAGTTVLEKGYNVTIKNGASFSDLYFSDRKPVAKTEFGIPVQFTFRSFGAKVRVGFYETIPGYKVTIKRFYYENVSHGGTATTDFDDMIQSDDEYFRAAVQNVQTQGVDNSFAVYYNAQNRPLVNNTTVTYNFNLKLGNNLKGKTIGTTSATATFDSEGGAFTQVFPFEAITNPMLVKCDYVIEAEDGQGETLEITGAKAIIPVQYLKWTGNCSYTYLFKIIENTNGTTGTGSDPKGLYSISFDAVSVSTDVNDQTTLTSVDKYSITSYRPGTDVYIVNTNKTDGSVYIPTAIGDESGNAQVYVVTTTGADIDEVNINARLMGVTNGISLEPLKIKTGEHAGQNAASLVYQVPSADGSYYTYGDASHPGALHFKAEMGYAYAYVYCGTKHVNATYSKVAGDASWSSTTTYYTNAGGVYTAASGVNESYFNTNKSSLYIQTSPGVAGEYAVMLLDTRGY